MSVRCLALFLFLCVACTQRSVPQKPAVDLPNTFSHIGIEQVPAQWWLCFNDKELSRAINIALQTNISIKQIASRLEQARAIARRDGSDRYPKLDVNASATRRFEDDGSVRSNDTTFGLGLSASYELDLWGRVRAAVSASELDAEAKQEDVYAAAISLSADVARVWFELASSHARIKLFEEELATQVSVEKIIKAQFKVGKVRAADVYRQQQLLAGTRASLSSEHGDHKLLRHQFMLLLGRPPQSAFDFKQPHLRTLPDLPVTGIPSAVLDRRPDIRSAWLAVLAADQEVQVAVADRYPRLSITASATTNADEIEDFFDAWIFRLIGNVVQPLFDGGRRSAIVDHREAVLKELTHVYAAAVLNALKEVEDALVREQKHAQFLLHVRQQLKANNMVLERSRDLYKQGQADYLRVLESLSSHLNIKERLVNAEEDMVLARIQLYRALAGSWQRPSASQKQDKINE